VAEFTVSVQVPDRAATPPSLAHTGFGADSLVALALLLVAVGSVALRAARAMRGWA